MLLRERIQRELSEDKLCSKQKLISTTVTRVSFSEQPVFSARFEPWVPGRILTQHIFWSASSEHLILQLLAWITISSAWTRVHWFQSWIDPSVCYSVLMLCTEGSFFWTNGGDSLFMPVLLRATGIPRQRYHLGPPVPPRRYTSNSTMQLAWLDKNWLWILYISFPPFHYSHLYSPRSSDRGAFCPLLVGSPPPKHPFLASAQMSSRRKCVGGRSSMHCHNFQLNP